MHPLAAAGRRDLARDRLADASRVVLGDVQQRAARPAVDEPQRQRANSRCRSARWRARVRCSRRRGGRRVRSAAVAIAHGWQSSLDRTAFLGQTRSRCSGRAPGPRRGPEWIRIETATRTAWGLAAVAAVAGLTVAASDTLPGAPAERVTVAGPLGSAVAPPPAGDPATAAATSAARLRVGGAAARCRAVR
jgi:hypothetical protein